MKGRQRGKWDGPKVRPPPRRGESACSIYGLGVLHSAPTRLSSRRKKRKKKKKSPSCIGRRPSSPFFVDRSSSCPAPGLSLKPNSGIEAFSVRLSSTLSCAAHKVLSVRRVAAGFFLRAQPGFPLFQIFAGQPSYPHPPTSRSSSLELRCVLLRQTGPRRGGKCTLSRTLLTRSRLQTRYFALSSFFFFSFSLSKRKF